MNIKNKMTFGPHVDKMVSELPDSYLLALARSKAVRQIEPDIYREVLQVCNDRHLSIVQPTSQTIDPSIRTAVQAVLSSTFRKFAMRYHPDQNKEADSTTKMAVLNEFHEHLKSAIQEVFDEMEK